MTRRKFITVLGAATVWPVAARAQQTLMPAIGFFGSESPALFASHLRMFRQAERDFDPVFTELVRLRASGLVIAIDSFFTARREQLGALALRHGIAAIYQDRDFAVAGGVISYGGSLTEGYRLVGVYTGRILKGEKPADLPVQQVTRVELIFNMKAPRRLESSSRRPCSRSRTR